MSTDDFRARREEDARWHRVYFAVIVYTVMLIGALWLFSAVFSR
jgi:hypothetical protein